jgi:hypothetical protein
MPFQLIFALKMPSGRPVLNKFKLLRKGWQAAKPTPMFNPLLMRL